MTVSTKWRLHCHCLIEPLARVDSLKAACCLRQLIDPTLLMARSHFASSLLSRDSIEGQRLLNGTPSLVQDDQSSDLAESMTARLKRFWPEDKSIANHSGAGSEPTLVPSADSYYLDDANLRAQGHEAALQRRFSPLAAIGLGFRYHIVGPDSMYWTG